MSKFYITFGQVHVHSVNGKTFDKNCLAELESETKWEAHKTAMDIFNKMFHQVLSEGELKDALPYYPRGVIKVYSNPTRNEEGRVMP